MFKINSLSIALLALFTLSACSQPQETSTKSAETPAQTTAPAQVEMPSANPTANPNLETHIALTDPTYPPFQFKQENGTIGGMEIDIFNAIAKDQGFNVTYTPHEWDGIFDTLNKPEATLVISAVGATEEAKSASLVSNPYYISPYRVLVLDEKKLEGWEKLPKIAVSESEDGFEDLPVRFGVKPEQMIKYPTVFLALTAVIRGEADAVVADSTVLQYNMSSDTVAQHKPKFVSKALPASDGSNLVFAVDKANPELLEKVNKGLANITASGELDKILSQYGQDVTLRTALKP